MPVLSADQLHNLLRDIFVAAQVPAERAEVVAEHLVKANLVGHDSHGAIRAPGYVKLIEAGKIKPTAPIEVHRETDGTAVVDGNWGLGFVVTKFAMDLAIDKAKANGVAAVVVRRQSHMGRLGWYAARAAERGAIAFVTADSGRAPKVVAPLGGRDRRLGTNPLSFAVPAGSDESVILDMATSAVAQGKVRVAKARGELLPFDCIVSDDGVLTSDPTALGEEDGGALIPFGGKQAHKGYGLSFMVEVLSGLLTGIGFSHDPTAFSNDGAFIAVFDVDRFQDTDAFTHLMSDFIAYLKDSRLAEGATEILYPGELELRTEAARRNEGISIEESTFARLRETATRLGVDMAGIES
jgi:LDH2 family malate/lactate/ureidoglycolate dehydrogenase